MTELGEAITDPNIFVSDHHDEKICPWHAEGKAGAQMAAADEGEDKPRGKVKTGRTRNGMPENDGGRLGDNMIAKEIYPPEVCVRIHFVSDGLQEYRKGKKDREMVIYAHSRKTVTYPLDFAAHHLIPGNAALKNSAIAPFLGDKATVTNFAKTSRIRAGSAGYDVNCAENGQWLPSPYALSMNDGNSPRRWPNEPGMKAALRDEGEETVEALESFKLAYAKAAVKAAKGAQFHMCHEDYSAEVRRHLHGIKVKMMNCPLVAKKKNAKLDEPPGGLANTLNALSARLRGLLTGEVWHSPFFVDSINKEIALPGHGQRYVVSKARKII